MYLINLTFNSLPKLHNIGIEVNTLNAVYFIFLLKKIYYVKFKTAENSKIFSRILGTDRSEHPYFCFGEFGT